MNELQIAELTDRIWQSGPPREDLVARVAGAIRAQITAGHLTGGSRLPGEAELARRLAISRPTLREATRRLAQEGLLDIRHGVGTFVAEPARSMSSALDTMRSMSALIRAAGGVPGDRDAAVRRIGAEGDVARALDLAPDTTIAEVTRVRLIDGRPLALAFEYVPLFDAATEWPLIERFCGGSIYTCLAEKLGRLLVHSEMSVTAVSAGERRAALLGLQPRAPLLLMREVHFDDRGRRAFYSVNYHNSAVVEFTLLRAGRKS